MNNWTFMRVFATMAAAGFITAVVLLATYLLQLPIFDRTALAWCFFYSLCSAGLALFALIVRSIWEGYGDRS